MAEANTAVRRFYESLSTGNATLADEHPGANPVGYDTVTARIRH
jgi:hypothetical protein